MRLKRLELQGFKSFLDRTILSFDPGITGVVGPNGCGKSNIVDAILWVMGEQSPKHLRGENMTDVIFNGSDSRQPTSMAEVSLVLDKGGVPLAPQFRAFDVGDEIAITRRIYRDGTGEFLINKVICRLKDIHELFMDTGVGRRAYSIIEQGQIDRMINVKPEERRHIFEEVAGITKYKAKRKEAERKLEQTRGNLTRLDDIVVELEKQLRSLKIQSTRARKYRELKGELETIDLHLLGRDLYRVRKELGLLEEERIRLQDDRTKWDNAVAARDAELLERDTRRIEEEKRYQDLSQKERALGIEAQKLAGDRELLAERKRNIERGRLLAEEEREELNTREGELRAEFDERSQTAADLTHRLQELDRALSENERALSEQQEARRTANRRREELLRDRSRSETEKAQLESRLESSKAREVELDDKERRLHLELEDMEAEAVRLSDALLAAEAKAQTAKDAIGQGETDVEDVGRQGKSLSESLSRVEEDLFALREQYHNARSRRESLEELQENLEGFPPSARELLAKAIEMGVSAKLLGDVVRPPKDLEEAVELFLGDRTGTLLVKSGEEARRVVELARDEGFQRVRVVAMEDLILAARPTAEREDALWKRVQADTGYEAALRWAFGDVVVTALDEELFRNREEGIDCGWLSAEGKLVAYADRSLEGGRAASRSGVFARKREMEELAVQADQLKAAVAAKTAEQAEMLAALKGQELRRDELKARLSELHMASVEARKDRERIAHERERFTREYARREQERDELAERRAEIESTAQSTRSRLEEVLATAALSTSELLEAENLLQLAEEAAEAEAAACNALRVDRGAQAERQTSLESALVRVESDLHAAQRRLTQLDSQEEERCAEESSLEDHAREFASREGAVKEELANTQALVAETQQRFYELCEIIQTLRDELAEWQKTRDLATQRATEVALRLEQEKSRSESLRQLTEERYQRELVPLDETQEIDVMLLPLFSEQLNLEWSATTVEERNVLLGEHAKSVREKVSRYGEVNLAAIQEHDEVQKRYDFLMEQRRDLESSIQLLAEAILRIDETSKARFRETFDAVEKKFSEIFPILFNGGKGELTLTNQDNPLESGVDILVQPPGKRLQSITLLSGGEKALTAVSLVLAIFARKPSPFCLLDEVDAPLDDANVSRFNTVIRKMAEKTQFIVITHNKKTMEIAEALYGVTMERAGVSKMASVRLH